MGRTEATVFWFNENYPNEKADDAGDVGEIDTVWGRTMRRNVDGMGGDFVWLNENNPKCNVLHFLRIGDEEWCDLEYNTTEYEYDGDDRI